MNIKNIKTKIVAGLALAFVSTFSSSCTVRFVDDQGQPIGCSSSSSSSSRYGGVQQGQQGQLESVQITQTRTGYCQARVKYPGMDDDRKVVAEYAAEVYMATGQVPSEEDLTSKFGFPAQARWIDTPDQEVKTIRVKPSEVPENIRKQFE